MNENNEYFLKIKEISFFPEDAAKRVLATHFISSTRSDSCQHYDVSHGSRAPLVSKMWKGHRWYGRRRRFLNENVEIWTLRCDIFTHRARREKIKTLSLCHFIQAIVWDYSEPDRFSRYHCRIILHVSNSSTRVKEARSATR